MAYYQLILPLKLGWLPTYKSSESLLPGTRVNVSFARRKYVGVVFRQVNEPDLPEERISGIDGVEEGLPRISPRETALWSFISDYYLCSLGEVYKAAYPAMKLRSEMTALNVSERAAASAQRRSDAALDMLRRRVERLEERLSAKREALSTAREGTVKRSRLEEEAARIGQQLEEASARISELEADREKAAGHAGGSHNEAPAVSSVPGPKPTVLVSTDRIDYYSTLISETLGSGRQVLVLTPDIAFCKRMSRALASDYGFEVCSYSSAQSSASRRKASDAARNGSSALFVGTRSAILLPYRDLGLIIVDDEQDSSYKQTEPAPRYNGRDAAIALASVHGAQVVLGSQTPSLETVYNCRTGKYSMIPIPPVPLRRGNCEVVDIAAERRKRGMVGDFSRKLLQAASDTAGSICLIRGWEKEESLLEQASRLLPGREVRICTLAELKRDGCSEEFIAVMQADALVSREDFRADERALQLVTLLESFAPRVLVQTTVADRFSGCRGTEALLEERRKFGFPPFTRLVDIRSHSDNSLTDRHFLARDKTLAARKAEIAASVSPADYIDVDPI